jgi:hypothetical protein
MRPFWIALLAVAASCRPGLDQLVLETEFNLGINPTEATFVCLGDDGSRTRVTGTGNALTCLGLRCEGMLSPGTGDCAQAATNPFLGTCVETFFSCYAPSGTCEVTASNDQITWTGGARLQFDFGDGLLYSSASADPCISFGYQSDTNPAFSTLFVQID